MPLVAVAVAVALAGCGARDHATRTGTGTSSVVTAAPPPTTTTTTGTVAQPAPQTETERVSDCLRKLGYRLTGGPPQTGGTEAPEFQIVLDSPHGGGYIGFYKNVSRAKRVAARLRANAKRTHGAAVERHGSIDIIWVDLAGSAARAGVRGCLVT
jgi:hypothetical protein